MSAGVRRRLGLAAFVAALSSTLLLGSCIVGCGCGAPPGVIRVEVVDPEGRGIPGVAVEHRTRYARSFVRATGPEGTVDFSAEVRSPHTVRVSTPRGYTLSPGDSGSREVTLERRETVTVRFVLARAAGGE